MSRGAYIAVAGNIGVGKSSLVNHISQRYGVAPFFEPNDENPFLADFYEEMPRWSFHSQIYFLASKIRLHRQLAAHTGHVIQDRTIWEDAEIFAENLARNGTMSKREAETYRMLFDSVRAELRPPDLMIYLRGSTKTLRKRIAKRGRDMEQEIPLAYLKGLQTLYDGWMERYTLSPVVTLELDDFDPVTDLLDSMEIFDLLEHHLGLG